MASTNMIAAAKTRLRLAGVCQRLRMDIVFLRCLGVPITRMRTNDSAELLHEV